MGSKAETDNENAAAALPDNDRCNFLRTVSAAVPHKVTEGSEKIDRVREVQGAAGREKPDAVCGVKSNRYSEYLSCRLEKRQKQAKV